MRKNFGAQTWLYPMPVLIIGTYNEDGSPNAMNAAWGGIHDTARIAVCIDPAHRTAANLLARKAFTVSIGDALHVAECDFLGIVSGNEDPGKLGKTSFHIRKAELVDAPLIEELPMTLECRLLHYDSDSGCTVGEILNVSADERVLDSDGRIDPAKIQAITFDPVRHRYLKLGEIAGTAFRDGRKLL